MGILGSLGAIPKMLPRLPGRSLSDSVDWDALSRGIQEGLRQNSSLMQNFQMPRPGVAAITGYSHGNYDHDLQAFAARVLEDAERDKQVAALELQKEQDDVARQMREAYARIDKQAADCCLRDVRTTERTFGHPLDSNQYDAVWRSWKKWAAEVKAAWSPTEPKKIAPPPAEPSPDLKALKDEREAIRAEMARITAALAKANLHGSAHNAVAAGLKLNADLGKVNTKIAHEEGLAEGKASIRVPPTGLTEAIYPGKMHIIANPPGFDWAVDYSPTPLAALVQETLEVGQDLLFPMKRIDNQILQRDCSAHLADQVRKRATRDIATDSWRIPPEEFDRLVAASPRELFRPESFGYSLRADR